MAPTLQVYYVLQIACMLASILSIRSVTGNGEVGRSSNVCYSSTPSTLPLTISYTKSATKANTTFTFLANVRQTNVEAFGIRLSSGLAAIPDRISATPQGQIIPPALGGPAYLWNITSMGQQLFIFSVNTSGLSASTGPGSDVRLSDICAQGIAVADNQGTPIWEQPSMNGSCVVWVKQADNCTFQSFSQLSSTANSTRPDPLAPAVPSNFNSVTLTASSPFPTPAPYGYSPQPSAPYSPAGFSPRPKPYTPSPPSPTLLFGVPPSPKPAVTSGAYSSPRASPYGYGAPPYGFQAPSGSPYYGSPSPGAYTPSAPLGVPPKQPLFGRRTLLQGANSEDL